MNKLSDKVAALAMERVAALLADRVVDSLMKAGFDKPRYIGAALLKAMEKEAREEGGATPAGRCGPRASPRWSTRPATSTSAIGTRATSATA
ncbi:MAG: hypothetical protein HY671_07250 [Chloroflexi bacterium]|nr:hypothetical protein [Chloroflexota bacterium]